MIRRRAVCWHGMAASSHRQNGSGARHTTSLTWRCFDEGVLLLLCCAVVVVGEFSPHPTEKESCVVSQKLFTTSSSSGYDSRDTRLMTTPPNVVCRHSSTESRTMLAQEYTSPEIGQATPCAFARYSAQFMSYMLSINAWTRLRNALRMLCRSAVFSHACCPITLPCVLLCRPLGFT
ncbi:unnamed protein product [Ectocarpus sp. 12 AP-2014]